MPKPDLYAALLQEYYRLEESLLADTPEAGRTAVGLAVSQLRAFVLKALQSQALRLSEIEDALRLTGETLVSAQQRMEAMEKENAEAAAVLFKMKVRGEAPPGGGEAAELADRVAEQEKLLRKREAELDALRRQVLEAQAERAGLLRRLEEEERRAAAPAAAVSGPEVSELGRSLEAAQAALREREAENERLVPLLGAAEKACQDLAGRLQEAEARARLKEAERGTLEARLAKVEPEAVSELQRLGGQLAEAQALDKQREAELAALAGRLEQAQADAAGLRGRLAAAQAPARPPEELPALRSRLAELERRLAEPGAEVEALRSRLKEEETFRAGFIQRIQSLEAARHRAQEEAKKAAQRIAAAEKVPWTEERAGLLSRVETLDRELRRVRAINENIQREWTETSSRQDAARLAEIAALKNELEKLHAHHRPA